jgi:formamidopyrimidine-DNA glycosylase
MLREQVSEAIDVEARDSLCAAVHGKVGQLCLRCGSLIGEVKREHVTTHVHCTCRPGLMVDRRRQLPDR